MRGYRATVALVLLLLGGGANALVFGATISQPQENDNFARSATIGCAGSAFADNSVTVKMYDSEETIVDSASTTANSFGVWTASLEPNPTWGCGSYTIKVFEATETEPSDTVNITVMDSGC